MTGMEWVQLVEYVIRPVIQDLGMHSLAAENLLLGTAAQESHMGKYIKQLGSGPALGIYQCEPATHRDILDNWLRHKPELDQRVARWVAPATPRKEQLVWNLGYATAIARCHYRRIRDPLPAHDDIPALAAYWKRFYNTEAGRGTVEEFVENWERFVGRQAA